MAQRCPGQDPQFWTGDSAYEIRCPHCGVQMEFFKDEPVRTCRSCGKKVRNTKLDLGCAKWCKYAERCLGQLPGDADEVGSLCRRIIEKMKSHFGDDEARIDHSLSVLRYAEQIMGDEPDVSGLVVRAAAILHDVGIPAAQRRHGSSAGKYQEAEGPPIARRMLEELDVDPAVIDHVCRIIANHHSAGDIDTPEFRIVWDADWLVNIPAQIDISDVVHTSKLISSVFMTEKGRRIAETTFLERDRT